MASVPGAIYSAAHVLMLFVAGISLRAPSMDTRQLFPCIGWESKGNSALAAFIMLQNTFSSYKCLSENG